MDGIQIYAIILCVVMGLGLLNNINNVKNTGSHTVSGSIFAILAVTPIVGRVLNWW